MPAAPKENSRGDRKTRPEWRSGSLKDRSERLRWPARRSQLGDGQFLINVKDNGFLDYRTRSQGIRLCGLQGAWSRNGRRNADRPAATTTQGITRTSRRSDSSSSRSRQTRVNKFMVRLHTNHGVIRIDLDAASAPETPRISSITSRPVSTPHGVSPLIALHDPAAAAFEPGYATEADRGRSRTRPTTA